MNNLNFESICKESFKTILSYCAGIIDKSGTKYIKEDKMPVLDDYGYNSTITKESLDYKQFLYDNLINLRQFEPYKKIVDQMSHSPIFLKYYSGIVNEAGKKIEIPDAQDVIDQIQHDFVNVLTYTYLTGSKSVVFNEEFFNSVFNHMMNFVTTDSRNAYAFLPIYGLAGNFSEIILSHSVKISKLTPRDFLKVSDMDIHKLTVPGKRYQKLKYAVYLKLDVPIGEIISAEKIMDVSQKVLDTLRLFKSGTIHFGAIYSYSPDLWPRDNLLSPKIGTENPPEIINSLEIMSSEIQSLTNFYNEYMGSVNDPDSTAYLMSAIRRFNISYENKIIGDRIADLCISLETMLVDSQGEITLKLALLVAVLLGEDENQREYLWRFIKKCYNVRSEIVHGKKRTKITVLGKEYTDNETAIELENITRDAIKKIIQIQKQFKSQQDLIDRLMTSVVNRNQIIKIDEL